MCTKAQQQENQGKGLYAGRAFNCSCNHCSSRVYLIPIFTSQLHKARVATDWANLRAYYAEIQADFISTGKYNKKVPYEDKQGSTGFDAFGLKEITFLNGQKVKM